MTRDGPETSPDATHPLDGAVAEPLRLPSEACTVLARALDRWAREQEDVRVSLGGLPKFDRHGAYPSAGLYVDDRRAPWLEAAGELRFSLARLYSVTPSGIRLVGQIQITAVVRAAKDGARADPGAPPVGEVLASANTEVRIRFYVHELDAPGTREVDSRDEFESSVLKQHGAFAKAAAPKDEFDPAFM